MVKDDSEESIHKGAMGRVGANHICGLPERDNIVVHYIHDGYFISLRRKFRRLMMVSDSNPLCKVYLRSSAAIRMEQTRHLHYHYYIIHPFSQYQQKYEIFRLAILTLLLIVIPIDVCQHDVYLTFFKLVLDCCTIFGIITIFSTGFLHPATDKIILHRKDIARRYLCRFFLIDCVTSCTIFLVILQMCFPQILPLNKIVYIKMVNYLKLFRLSTWIRYWECFRQWRQLNIYKFKILKLFLYYSFTIWWSACILYVIQLFPAYDASMFNRNVGLSSDILVNCVYHVVYMVFQIGSGEQSTNRLDIIIAQIVVLLIGYYLYLYSVSQVMIIVHKYSSSKTKYMEIQQQLKDFLRQKEVPKYTRRRVMMYFDFKFQRHYYKESEVLSNLSKNLRQDIFLHRCKNLVLRARIFKVIPQSLLNRLVSFMRTRIYLCNDLIVQAGTDGADMYFVYSGTVAVYTPHGREVCHLTEGANFGEVSLIFEYQARAASVIAIDTVEIYTLGREDFLRAIEPFPDVHDSMRATAEEHMKHVLLTESEDSSSDVSSKEDPSRSSTSEKSNKPDDPPDEKSAMITRLKSRLHYRV